MKRTISILMLGIAVMLASCSQDEDTLQTNAKEGTMTFTATLDGSMNLRAMKTRSVTDPTDETVTRAVLEIYDNQNTMVGSRIAGTINGDNITFTANLEEGATYTCLFWADGGEGAYNIADLTAITRGATPSIAYYAKKEITASSTPENVILTHAVSKVVLHETGTLAVGDKVGVSFTLPEYSFDVTDGSCTAGTNETISGSFDIASTTTGQVGWLYVFAPSTGADLTTVTLSYIANGGSEKTKEISNVPLKPNHRTVLKGEFAKIGVFTQGFNVTLDKNWEEDNTYLQRLVTTTAGQITADPTLIEQALNADGTLVIEGPVNTADIYAVGYWGQENPDMLISVDLSGTTGLTEISIGTFSFNPPNVGDLSSLTAVILPSSLQTIGIGAFQNSGLVEIEIPDNVTSIGRMCFAGCAVLESVTLPKNLTALGISTFTGCPALKEITVPANVKVIATDNFSDTALETLVFEGNIPVLSSTDNEPAGQSGKLVISHYIMGFSNPVTGFNVFLPNISNVTTVGTYKTYFATTAQDVYYNYTGGVGGDKTDPANYIKYE